MFQNVEDNITQDPRLRRLAKSQISTLMNIINIDNLENSKRRISKNSEPIHLSYC